MFSSFRLVILTAFWKFLFSQVENTTCGHWLVVDNVILVKPLNDRDESCLQPRQKHFDTQTMRNLTNAIRSHSERVYQPHSKTNWEFKCSHWLVVHNFTLVKPLNGRDKSFVCNTRQWELWVVPRPCAIWPMLFEFIDDAFRNRMYSSFCCSLHFCLYCRVVPLAIKRHFNWFSWRVFSLFEIHKGT